MSSAIRYVHLGVATPSYQPFTSSKLDMTEPCGNLKNPPEPSGPPGIFQNLHLLHRHAPQLSETFCHPYLHTPEISGTFRTCARNLHLALHRNPPELSGTRACHRLRHTPEPICAEDPILAYGVCVKNRTVATTTVKSSNIFLPTCQWSYPRWSW